MKRLILFFVIMLFSASGMFAQRFSPERIAQWRTDVLTEKLDLSDDQKEEVYYIYLQYARQRQTNRAETDSIKSKQAFAKARKELDTAIKSVLTEEQRSNYIEIQRNRKNTVKVQILLQDGDR